MATKLFVGNLTYTSTENDLQDLFSQAGGVISVNIMQDRTTGRSRGFAFIEMASPADAEKAISMFHQKDFQGRALTVNEARPREERPPGQRFSRGPGAAGGGSVAVEIVATAAEDTAIATKPQSLNPAGKIAVSNLECGQLAAGLDVASDANWKPVENRIAVVPYGSGFVRNRK